MNNLPADPKPVGHDETAAVEPEKSSATQNPDAAKVAGKPSSGRLMKALRSFWQALELRRIIFKTLTLLYALAIFGYAYFQMASHRSVLSYMGVMLLMVIVYAEILVIRDHLWVIEGSMRESRRWRDIFFSQTSLRRQRIRKFLSILFATCIFSYMYFKAGAGDKGLLSFMGIMLLMTVLYYEILTIRDEVFIIGQSLQPESDAEVDKRKEHYDKLIEKAKNGSEVPSVQPSDNATHDKS
ncbi:MAG: hypothetical protein CVV42_17035 [Candidatus Riflebacteria bacterium HGW-Riflebacteria-2]|jgi:hypothetical protein|nr:MAG: hypothetical protein CVV42_17035 [Candidatus Riflebacteria bacterium HGW-Riflebacteria-2]